MHISSLSEASEILLARARKMTRDHSYTLDRMRSLMHILGDPQDEVPVIHIAGTSGKTSTAYYTAALLQMSGKQVGLMVSPHINSITDRVQINGQPISDEEFCRRLGRFLEIIDAHNIQPTYFECMTAFAYWVFAARQLDYMVIEVGLGGLLDSTNVINRQDKVCVITDIGFDHMEVLGSTLPEIAAQKAGIIQPHNQVFMLTQPAEVMNVVESVARRRQASLFVETHINQNSELPLFQQRNYSLAHAVVSHVLAAEGKNMIDAESLALATTIPARMEHVLTEEGLFILDGAHNPQKMQALADAIAQKYNGKKLSILVALKDKAQDIDRMIATLQPLVPLRAHIFATTFGGPEDWPYQGADIDLLSAAAKAAGLHPVTTITDTKEAFTAFKQVPADLYIVAGSFYLLNHIRPQVLAARNTG